MLLTCFTSRIYGGICWLKMPCLLPLLLGFKVVRHIDGWPLIHLSFHSSLWDTVYEKFNLRLPAQNGIWVKCMAKNSFIIYTQYKRSFLVNSLFYYILNLQFWSISWSKENNFGAWRNFKWYFVTKIVLTSCEKKLF